MSWLKNNWFLVSVVAIASFSCARDNITYKNCACTKENRYYSVYITDSNHVPIDSLITIVTNTKTNFVYRTDSSSITNLLHIPGWYMVLNDGNMKYFTTIPETVIFHAMNQTYNISQQFSFYVDDCNCHLQKASGPDSLIVP